MLTILIASFAYNSSEARISSFAYCEASSFAYCEASSFAYCEASSFAYNSSEARISRFAYMIKPKDRKHLDFDVWLKEELKNPAFKAEFDGQQPEFAVINAIIEARRNEGITQKSLAQKIGTKQSVISRLESGKANPSVAFLKKLAEALNSHLEIRFTSFK